MTRRVGTLSFRSESLPAAEIGGILDQAFEIAIRPGLHCAPYIHRAIGTFPDGAVRVSPGAVQHGGRHRGLALANSSFDVEGGGGSGSRCLSPPKTQ